MLFRSTRLSTGYLLYFCHFLVVSMNSIANQLCKEHLRNSLLTRITVPCLLVHFDHVTPSHVMCVELTTGMFLLLNFSAFLLNVCIKRNTIHQ